jgi:chaperonin GroEL
MIPGGEIIYLLIRDRLDKTDLGQKILYDALLEPFRKLVSNAGYDGGELYNEFKHSGSKGFDVITGEWKDMVKVGIIDPSQVPITAIKSAVSVAIQLMTVGAAIVPDNDEMSNLQKTTSQ